MFAMCQGSNENIELIIEVLCVCVYAILTFFYKVACMIWIEKDLSQIVCSFVNFKWLIFNTVIQTLIDQKYYHINMFLYHTLTLSISAGKSLPSLIPLFIDIN